MTTASTPEGFEVTACRSCGRAGGELGGHQEPQADAGRR
jgi:hypothetical protein